MTSPALYDENYFQLMRGIKEGGDLHGRFLSLLRQHRPVEGEVQLLDLGCGQGHLLELLSHEDDLKVQGLDFSPAAVAASRERVGPKVALTCGSATEVGHFAGESFHLICMMDVIEHLPPDQLLQTLQNVRTWLKPGGRLVAHTFPTLGLHRLYQTLLKLLGKREELDYLNRIHCNVQTRQSLAATLLEAGLNRHELWLQNDFTLTSSTYQRLPEGVFKKGLGFVLEDLLGNPTVQRVCQALGLLELVAPSLYCVAVREA